MNIKVHVLIVVEYVIKKTSLFRENVIQGQISYQVLIDEHLILWIN